MPDIELKKIKPNRLNPRAEFSKLGLDELSDSIKLVGVLEPVIVREVGDDSYEIVVGERRYRAAQQAGLEVLPVVVKNYNDEEVMEINLIENVQREDLSAVDKGRMCKRLLENFPHKFPNQESIAKSLGVNRSRVGEWIQTTVMPEEVQRRIAPETYNQKVPLGKIDYTTAVRIGRQITEQKKFVEVIDYLSEKRVPRRLVEKATKQIVQQPDRSVEAVFKEVVDDAPIFLPFSKEHADAILKQVKKQTSRKAKDPRLQKGVRVRAQVTYFADLEIEDVYRKKLGEFNEEDARREGGYTLEEFKEVWKKLHGKWDDRESVYVIKFRLEEEAEKYK